MDAEIKIQVRTFPNKGRGIFAIKDIKEGEEITIHYGEHWWKKRGKDPIE